MDIGNLAKLTAFEMKTASGEKLSLARSLSDFAAPPDDATTFVVAVEETV